MKLRWRIQERTLEGISAVSAVILICLTLAATLSSQKHSPFLIGLMAPVLGLPHFLTLLGVGAWAGRLGQPGTWILPGSFLVGMIPGFVFGVVQVPLPALDLMIKGLLLASLVPLAAAILMPIRLANPDAAMTMMVVGGLHGHLLGTEAYPASSTLVALGVIGSSNALLCAGAGVGLASSRLR